ncbi:MAG: ABC transporter permease [Bacilli bacterium]
MTLSNIVEFVAVDASMQGFIWAILALGVFIAYKVLNVADMSVDSLFPFAGIISLTFINLGMDPLVSIILSIMAGMLVGLINAALHLYLHIHPLLAGIVIMVALYTPNVILAPGVLSVAKDKNTIFTIVNGLINNLDVTKILLLLIFVAIFFALVYWFFGTQIGLSLRASGKNKEMSMANGVNTNNRYILGMMISSALVALSGALYAQMNKYTSPDTGRGAIIVGLTIIFLGEVILSDKKFWLSLVSIVLGGLIYWVIIDLILSIPSFNTNFLKLMQGAMIVIVVIIGQVKKKFSDMKLKKKFKSDTEKGEVTV